MKLYKISQTINNDYDTYDAFVVAAETEEDARNFKILRTIETWADPEHVSVEYLGEAGPLIEAGEILGSFNAG